MKAFLTLILVLSLALVSSSQSSFEGIMDLVRTTKIDTTTYKYYVKNNMIRIEEINGDKQVEGIMLIDIKNKKLFAMSPIRKLYYEIPFKQANIENLKDKIEIEKRQNKKTIAGYECVQWIVKNQTENTVISYWVVPSGFNFFKDFLITLNRKDKIPSYFLQISDIQGVISLSSTERTMLRDFVSSLDVTNITTKKLPDNLFNIPSDYKEFVRK